MSTIILLSISNIFMTFAWYGHLSGKQIFGIQLPSTKTPLFLAILISWGIAFLEYCFQVPANRIGASQFTFVQLKTLQEVISLCVFAAFSILFLKENLSWNHYIGFIFLILAAAMIFRS